MAIKVGVIGTGMIAHMLVPHMHDWGFDVIALSARHPESYSVQELVDVVQKTTGKKPTLVSDPRELVELPEVEVVYVAVPNALHLEMSLLALSAKKDVILEKPFCTNSFESETLADAAHAAGKFVLEATTTIHLPNFKKLHELLPKIAPIKLVSVNYSQYSSRYDRFLKGDIAPAFNPAMAGGALMDLGIYNINYLVGLFGAPKSVHYLANIQNNIDTSGVLTLDYGDFKAESIAAKDCGAPGRCVIQGSQGYLLQETPANNCGAITLHFNSGDEEHYDLNPDFQWDSEFIEFNRILNKRDSARAEELLQHSLVVSHVATQARQDAHIVFPADSNMA